MFKVILSLPVFLSSVFPAAMAAPTHDQFIGKFLRLARAQYTGDSSRVGNVCHSHIAVDVWDDVQGNEFLVLRGWFDEGWRPTLPERISVGQLDAKRKLIPSEWLGDIYTTWDGTFRSFIHERSKSGVYSGHFVSDGANIDAPQTAFPGRIVAAHWQSLRWPNVLQVVPSGPQSLIVERSTHGRQFDLATLESRSKCEYLEVKRFFGCKRLEYEPRTEHTVYSVRNNLGKEEIVISSVGPTLKVNFDWGSKVWTLIEVDGAGLAKTTTLPDGYRANEYGTLVYSVQGGEYSNPEKFYCRAYDGNWTRIGS